MRNVSVQFMQHSPSDLAWSLSATLGSACLQLVVSSMIHSVLHCFHYFWLFGLFQLWSLLDMSEGWHFKGFSVSTPQDLTPLPCLVIPHWGRPSPMHLQA